jgi:uncharacterized protein
MIAAWRTHTTVILVTGVLLLIIASAVAFMITTFQPKTEVRLGDGVFAVSIADDEAERIKGLAGVASLGPLDGKLFDFETEEKWGIWMKGMKVPIDIIWLNESRDVVHIVTNAPPELGDTKTYTPTSPARFVLEIAAGGVAKNGISIGDRALFVLDAGAQ